MKYIIAILLGLIVSTSYAQDVIPIENPKAVKLTTPNKEMEDYLVWLQEQPEPDRIYLRGFTTYSIPQDLRADAALQLSFLLHSLTGLSSDPDGGAGGYYPVAIATRQEEKAQWDGKTIRNLQLVPGSETLYWIDIRNYNWTPEAWEKITKFDGYMVEPIVKPENNGLLRLLAGNALVRMDWFIAHASLSVKQIDVDKAGGTVYRTLLYSQVKEPKTVQEFRAAWGLPDLAKSRQLGNEFAAIVTKSQNVSRHNRILFGYRTELGWLYQTYDVKHQLGLRDYIEQFPTFKGKPPTTFDGGEIFATNQLKLQTYDLYDDKENLADFADPTIVRHLSDLLGDARVQVPHGCFDCHAEGPLPSENTLMDYLKKNGNIYYKDYNDKIRVERTYFSGKFEESVKENQELFAKALMSTNGLLPAENIKSYMKVLAWYNKPLDLKQVAFECGVTPEHLIEKSKEGLQDINKKLPGRLDLLIKSNEPIPRDVWEAPNVDGIPGTFQQTMIVINGLTKITTQAAVVVNYVAIVNKKCNIYKTGSVILKSIEKDTKVTKITDTNDDWYMVELEDGTKGWIQKEDITKEDE